MKIEDLYMQYKQDIYNYIMGLTHNPSTAEDILSETFLKAIGSLHTFRKESSVKTWLCGIARNSWLQHLRSQKPQIEYDDLVDYYISESIEENSITKEIAARIHELLREKKEKIRNVVLMRVDGISYSEIAKKLDMSESSARVADFRTKRWLRSKLEAEGLI